MSPNRVAYATKMRAAVWLLLAIGVAVACAIQLRASGRVPVQTNLLALLPTTERNPVAEMAVAKLASVAGDRAIFLVGGNSLEAASAAAREYATRLRESGAFRQVFADVPSIDPKTLFNIYVRHRYWLLNDVDRQALASGTADLEGRLLRKLHAPVGLGPVVTASDDPFGFTDAWLAGLPLNTMKLRPEGGVLVRQVAGLSWVLVSAELAGTAYDATVQSRVATAVAAAEAAIQRSGPGTTVLRTGTVFYADAARRSAEREFDVVGVGSLAGMALLLYLVFRSLVPLALGLLSVAFGVGAAIAVTVAVYGEIHLITLVFGASLIGEAIDYAVQYFAAHMGAGRDWQPMDGLRRVAPGLILALGTSLMGYATLMLAPFPALSQIALFAFVGLGAAWSSVFLLLPALLTRPSQRDPRSAVAYAQRMLTWWKASITPRRCIVLIGLLVLLAIPGWLKLSSNDDIRLLVARPPALAEQEDKIREVAGLGNGSRFFLVEAKTADAAIAHEEKLAKRLNALVAQGAICGFQALSAFVPSLEMQAENRRIYAAGVFADPVRLTDLVRRSDLRDDVADRQIAAFSASGAQPLRLEDWLHEPVSTPFRHLSMGHTGRGYATIVVPDCVREAHQLAPLTAGLDGITWVDKPDSVSRYFRDYRRWGGWWLVVACALVYGVLSIRYGWRASAVVLIPTLLAMALAFSVFGYIGTPVTLFNLMAQMLVLGIGVNYAIFLKEGMARAAATVAGVLLSAGTTLLSFGLLAFSSMPALSGFGLTLLVGIGIAVLLAPIVLTFAEE